MPRATPWWSWIPTSRTTPRASANSSSDGGKDSTSSMQSASAARKARSSARLFFLFYRILNKVSRTPMPADAGNFGLMDARVVRELAALLDRDRYFAGLRSWVGFKQVGVPVERGPRYDDCPRVTMRGLWRLAQGAIFSFSTMPLSIFYGLGLTSMFVFLGLGSFCLYHKIFTGLAVPGWTSTTMTASFSAP